MCNGTTSPRGGRSLQSQHVPAASVWFPDEDRAEILRMIDEALAHRSSHPRPHRRTPRGGVRRPPRRSHAVAVASGTSALEIVLRAVGVDGREVDRPGQHVLRHRGRGASPRAAASASPTATRPPSPSIRRPSPRLLGPATAAVVVVHIGGLVAPAVRELQALCAAAGVALVEDAAHAHGSSLDGQSAGTFGVAGTFSFYPTKVIAGGEGGMIVTDDAAPRRRGAHLPRPGQGVVPHQLPHPPRQQLAHERAARGDRADAAAPPGRVHRPPHVSRRRLRPPPCPSSG